MVEERKKLKVVDCKHARFGVVFNGVTKEYYLCCLKCGQLRPEPATPQEVKRWQQEE